MSIATTSNRCAYATLSAAANRARDSAHGPVWLALRDRADILSRAHALDAMHTAARTGLPLFGLPFAVKDNIDVAGLPTTAGCPGYSYAPDESAPVVALLEAAGAVCIGKTHLDQFATGLTGTRSPHGALPNPFDSAYVSGGSSSGSAVAVALGHAAFALGTDTAGSGRVPAGFNNLVGIKPSRGLISARGVVPACRSLDCVSILAADLGTAWAVMRVAARFDDGDPFARQLSQRPPFAGTYGKGPVRLAIPQPLELSGDRQTEMHFGRIQDHWLTLGAVVTGVPFEPFVETARLLYDGPWVAERAAAFGAFVAAHPEQCDPAVRSIVDGAALYSATDAFRASYRLKELAATIAPLWNSVDALLLPTAPGFPRLAEVAAEPFAAHGRLGRYCNFVNLLDLAAIAVPAGFRSDGLPAGFTLVAPAGSDHALAELAHRYLAAHPHRMGTSERVAGPGPVPEPLDDGRPAVRLAVAGAHMRGMPLNYELVAQRARFVCAARTAPNYRLHALPGRIPKPGLVRTEPGAGRSIGLELWDVPQDRFGSFVAAIPPPLAIGSVEIEDGAWVKGFVCEPIALRDAVDITAHGDWRTYLGIDAAIAPGVSTALT